MKNLFLILPILLLSACGTAGNARTGLQDLEKSPCACLDIEYQIFNGKIYKIKKIA